MKITCARHKKISKKKGARRLLKMHKHHNKQQTTNNKQQTTNNKQTK
jgi:hypothetical protein